MCACVCVEKCISQVTTVNNHFKDKKIKYTDRHIHQHTYIFDNTYPCIHTYSPTCVCNTKSHLRKAYVKMYLRLRGFFTIILYIRRYMLGLTPKVCNGIKCKLIPS